MTGISELKAARVHFVLGALVIILGVLLILFGLPWWKIVSVQVVFYPKPPGFASLFFGLISVGVGFILQRMKITSRVRSFLAYLIAGISGFAVIFAIFDIAQGAYLVSGLPLEVCLVGVAVLVIAWSNVAWKVCLRDITKPFGGDLVIIGSLIYVAAFFIGTEMFASEIAANVIRTILVCIGVLFFLFGRLEIRGSKIETK